LFAEGHIVEQHALLKVLRETRALLARPDDNFDRSSWRNGEVALREIDALIAAVCKGALPDPKRFAAGGGKEKGDDASQKPRAN
jgi:hypothetical protein